MSWSSGERSQGSLYPHGGERRSLGVKGDCYEWKSSEKRILSETKTKEAAEEVREEQNDMQYVVLCVLQDHKSQEQTSIYAVGFDNNKENVSSHL